MVGLSPHTLLVATGAGGTRAKCNLELTEQQPYDGVPEPGLVFVICPPTLVDEVKRASVEVPVCIPRTPTMRTRPARIRSRER